MTIKIDYNVKKSKLIRKIRSECHLLLSQYLNRSITKKFSIKELSEMIDSSVKSLEEVEYDNQNSLRHQKTPVQPKNSSEDYLLLLLYINRPTTEKLPTKRILKAIDSSVRNTGEVEYDTQNCLQHHKSHAWPKNSK